MTNASRQLQVGGFAVVVGFDDSQGTALPKFRFSPGPA
jgi:hypothetical protein